MKSLRILLINSTDIGGGAEKIALTLHQRLIELGLDSKLLVQQKKSALNSVMEINDLKNQVIEFRPDVIHAHNLHGTTVSLTDLAHISQRIPTLFTLHDSWLSTGSVNHPFVLDSSKLNLLELMDWKQQLTERKSVLSSAEIRFATPSQWMSERMFDSHGIRPFFVLNAVESIPSIDMEIPSNRFILFVANRPKTNPYKDFSTLKKALKKANSKLGPNGCDLIVLGGESDTEKFENYSIIILENQSAERVRSFMEQSVLVVQASVQDNAPLTILESHAAGKKVLASLVGGVPELLDDEEQSWMYEAENVNNLAKKLFQAILSKSESKPLSHVGIESMTNTYLGHYVELVNGH